jgi:hypothetical protein
VVEVDKPAGATVRSAFLSCAAAAFNSALTDSSVTLAGVPIAWDQNISNGIFPSNTFADVTSTVKPTVDAAAAGRVPFTIIEVSPFAVDGCVLGVVLDNPTETKDSTVVVSFGGQATTGDTFAITLSEPLDLSDPESGATMGLGISFSAQDQFGVGGSHLCGTDTGQDSQIDVNGERLTSCAGNEDDGVGPISNGMLFTIGGLDDAADNPTDPLQRSADGQLPRVTDDELYDLRPFVAEGDTLITVDTLNPSNDDNIFLAYFVTSVPAIVGEGIVLAPASAANFVGESHTVTATVADDNGQPIVGRQVTFQVISGPHAGLNGTDDTDADGKATFTYTGTAPGSDSIQASFVNSSAEVEFSNTATKDWLAAPNDTCSSTPATGCRQATMPGRGRFLLKSGSDSSGNKLIWEWKRGQQTTLSDLGDPIGGTTSYGLCIYDESAGTSSLVLSAKAPEASQCTGACWRKLGTRGLSYVDPANAPDGIRRIVIRANREGRARILVKAKGDNLEMPTLPLAQDLRVRVQLINSDGVCWESNYTGPADRNDQKMFRDSEG